MKTMIAHLIEEELHQSHLSDETNQEFIQRICAMCLDEIEAGGKAYSPMGFGEDVINEIELAVTEVFKMRIYGHYNLKAYRKAYLMKRICSSTSTPTKRKSSEQDNQS
jgi:hypothetical protein